MHEYLVITYCIKLFAYFQTDIEMPRLCTIGSENLRLQQQFHFLDTNFLFHSSFFNVTKQNTLQKQLEKEVFILVCDLFSLFWWRGHVGGDMVGRAQWRGYDGKTWWGDHGGEVMVRRSRWGGHGREGTVGRAWWWERESLTVETCGCCFSYHS